MFLKSSYLGFTVNFRINYIQSFTCTSFKISSAKLVPVNMSLKDRNINHLAFHYTGNYKHFETQVIP